MKKLIPLLSTGLFLMACGSESLDAKFEEVAAAVAEENVAAPAKPGFDAELAKELGADAYGMRSYIFVTIKTGPNDDKITDEAERAELFKGHFENMGRLADEGKLVLAGPFMESPPLRGLFVFDVETIEEAKELVKGDPTVTSGVFELEFSKYYGSAALKKVNEIHANIQEKDM